MLDVSDLRFLKALSAAPSLAAAARNLGVTPPAVSQRLALLEDRLHLRLIERGRGHLRLTAEGAYLVGRAKGILGEVESLAEDMLPGRVGSRGRFMSLHLSASGGCASRRFSRASAPRTRSCARCSASAKIPWAQ